MGRRKKREIIEEYYCTNCGAILNDQSGFDAGKHVWTCTECKTLLMDSEIGNGPRFEGTAWFCDNCDALLSIQTGFSDLYDSWTCTECYHVNPINSDVIFETDDDYLHSKEDQEDKIICPSCGADLNEQWMYSSYKSDWECTECNTKLHREYSWDEYEIVEENEKERCPSCGADLNEQWMYSSYKSDWECKECHTKLHRDYGWDEYEIVEENKKERCPSCGADLTEQWLYDCNNTDWECTECNTKLHRDYGWDEYEVADSDFEDDSEEETYYSNFENDYSDYTHNTYESYHTYTGKRDHTDCSGYDKVKDKKINESNINLKSKSKPKIKFMIIAILVIIFIGFGFFTYYELTHLIPVGYSSDSLEGLRYTVVVEKLKESGFTNVRTEEIQDLTISREDEEKLVTDIKLGWRNSFSSRTKYPSNLKVVVVYHTVETYAPALSSKDAKGMSYEDVIVAFEDAGFTNIKTEVEYDILAGWFTDECDVKSLTINGNKKVNYTDEFRLDAEIVITYHALKKDRPD